jgi:hypothetical protein
MGNDIENLLIEQGILDRNYLTIFNGLEDEIIHYQMDFAGNFVPITYRRVKERKRRHYYGREPRKPKKLKIGKEIVVDLEICNSLGDL